VPFQPYFPFNKIFWGPYLQKGMTVPSLVEAFPEQEAAAKCSGENTKRYIDSLQSITFIKFKS
jgi:hypothetical protein